MNDNFPLIQQNRPLNSQNVADALQKFNLKKAAIQKALDNLADNGRISFKEYGKQKIYLARQDQFDIPNNEELNQMKEDNTKLQQQLQEQKRAISEAEGGTFCTPFFFFLFFFEIFDLYNVTLYLNTLLLQRLDLCNRI